MYSGIIKKMEAEYLSPVNYSFLIGNEKVNLNQLINKKITLNWSGKVQCLCGKRLSKFYRQNFCYQCYWNAPEASPSIFKPELCTADLGIEERDLEWEMKFQIAPHYIYLANSSDLKVGITRKTQQLTRWIDQGASQAVLIAEVPNRRISGIVELEFKKSISDRTNWRKMLSGEPSQLDMLELKKKYSVLIPPDLREFIINNDNVTTINYPVIEYPQKINSMSFQKQSCIEGSLLGIKGQYLLFDQGRVFNVRSHSGYIADLVF